MLIVAPNGTQTAAAVPSLRETGCNVHVADSPFRAISLHAQELFPVIVIDISRLDPDDNSIFEVFRESNPDVYILAIVPAGQRDKAISFLKAGIDAYTLEPIYVEEVVTLVRNAFERCHIPDPAAAREDKFKALGHLARGVAHAVNNPLTTLSGWLQIMLSDTGPDDPRCNTLAVMNQEADRIAKVVRNLLAFAGHPSPNCKEIDVNAMLDRLIMGLEQNSRHRTVVFSRHFTPGLGKVFADEDQLTQACSTIACFCAQRSGPGEGVDVATYPFEDQVRIEIADSGEPLARDEVDRLFDPFESYTKSDAGEWDSDSTDPSGLALPVCYGIIHGLGGALNITTGELQGTSFIIKLPVASKANLE